MSIFSKIANVALTALPVVVGVVATPAAGAGVAGVMGVLGLGKKGGQKIQREGVVIAGRTVLDPGHRPHKIGVPLAAVALSSFIVSKLPPEVMDQIQAAACQVCDDKTALAAVLGPLVGAVVVLWHQITRGVGSLGNQSE